MDKVTLPSGLQSLTFADRYDQSMDQMTLPSRLQSLAEFLLGMLSLFLLGTLSDVSACR
jgi:hypothetical protein